MLDRSNEAITHYERAVTIDPRRDDYHFQLGKALHGVGQDERAVKAYQMSIDLDPSDPAPHLSLGVSYEGLRRWNDAVGAYQRHLDLAPASPTTTALKWHVVALVENQERARAWGGSGPKFSIVTPCQAGTSPVSVIRASFTTDSSGRLGSWLVARIDRISYGRLCVASCVSCWCTGSHLRSVRRHPRWPTSQRKRKRVEPPLLKRRRSIPTTTFAEVLDSRRAG